MAPLADTCGAEVVGTVTQRLDTPNPATLIGTGKLEELEMTVLESGANVVVFDDELSPRQQRELEAALGEEVKVIDRTALILTSSPATRARAKARSRWNWPSTNTGCPA
ncbi:MAG: hypothetical protein R2854_29180 [Caldilineaceae bacterium]